MHSHGEVAFELAVFFLGDVAEQLVRSGVQVERELSLFPGFDVFDLAENVVLAEGVSPLPVQPAANSNSTTTQTDTFPCRMASSLYTPSWRHMARSRVVRDPGRFCHP